MTSVLERTELDEAQLGDVESGNGEKLKDNRGASVLDSILEQGLVSQNPVFGHWHCSRLGVDIGVRALLHDEYETMRKRATVNQRLKKTTTIHTTIDDERMNLSMIQTACVDPDFNDVAVRNRIAEASGHGNANTPELCIKLLFLPGEIMQLAAEILSISGFDTGEDTVEELKG